MGNKIFVGGLNWATNEDRLYEVFNACGEVVEAKVITDRETGRSRGFGFVTFKENQDADSAVQKFDGQEIDGRPVRVNIAEERRGPSGGGDRGGHRSHGGGGGGGGGGNGGGGRFAKNRW